MELTYLIAAAETVCRDANSLNTLLPVFWSGHYA
jgi:hypothetical protein